MKKIILALMVVVPLTLMSQENKKIFTSDIDNFWKAYDRIQTTKEYTEKINIINELYIDKGTKGLKAFMKARNYTDTLWVSLIEKLPKYWNSVRPNTLKIREKEQEMKLAIDRFKELYPELKNAEMYFTIGGLRSGGTTKGNMVLIGAEIATADASVDVTEFTNDWLPKVFAKQSNDNIVSLNIHEYVHTQQKNGTKNVLGACIREGSCDFISELTVEKTLNSQYLMYGREHLKEVKEQFRLDLFSSRYKNWLYNGGQLGEKSDLGYFIGYEICHSYYKNAENKSTAIKDIINLDYSNEEEVLTFLKNSKFYSVKELKDAIRNSKK